MYMMHKKYRSLEKFAIGLYNYYGPTK